MKKAIITGILAAIIQFSCSEDSYVGEGPIVVEEISLDNFSAIESMGSFEVEIERGTVQKVEITGRANIIDRLEREVSGNIWRIELQDGNYKNADLSIRITVPEMNRAILEGSGKIVLNGFKSQEQVSLGIYGSGDIEFYGNEGCKHLDLEIEGSGSILAYEDFSDIEQVNLRISGSGSFTGYPLITPGCLIDVLGSGVCKVNVGSDLKVNVEGSGKVYYQGNPTIESSISGSGKLINDNM